jgi:hypothetical protein
MKQRLLLLTFIPFLFSACNTTPQRVAKVVDSEVEGIEYQCSGLIGYTDKNGTLTCSHMPLAFKIGEIRLGRIYEIPEDGIILPQDIVNVDRSDVNNTDVIKVLTILQTLDEDKNPENGITITKETRDKLSDVIINVKKENLENIKEIITAQIGDINFTKPQKSIIHLNRSMRKYNIKESKVVPKIDIEQLTIFN